MRPPKSAKPRRHRQIVAVIASPGDLNRAARLRRLPDFFEVRLDALFHSVDKLADRIARLRAPLILTARHAGEGGQHELSDTQRRELLLRFLPHARYADVELQSLRALAPVIAAAARASVKLIISVHHFDGTPPLREVSSMARRARLASADVFKLVTRVDTRPDLMRLIEAFEASKSEISTSAMGVGRLGRESRRELIARGSVLNYAHLGAAQADGQFSLSELRRIARAR